MKVCPNEGLPTSLKRVLIHVHILKLLMYISEVRTNSRQPTSNKLRTPKIFSLASKVISSTLLFSSDFANVLMMHYVSIPPPQKKSRAFEESNPSWALLKCNCCLRKICEHGESILAPLKLKIWMVASIFDKRGSWGIIKGSHPYGYKYKRTCLVLFMIDLEVNYLKKLITNLNILITNLIWMIEITKHYRLMESCKHKLWSWKRSIKLSKWLIRSEHFMRYKSIYMVTFLEMTDSFSNYMGKWLKKTSILLAKSKGTLRV